MEMRSLYKLIALSMAVTALSCVNEEYDITKIKVDTVAGLEGITLPVGSTKMITSAELLGFDTDDEHLKTDSDGNYYLTFGDADLLDEAVEIPDFSFSGYNDDNPHDFTVDELIEIKSLNSGYVSPVIPFTDVIYDIEIDQTDIPEIVGGILYAEVDSDIIVRFEYDKSILPFNYITIAAGTSIEFPEWIVLGTPGAEFISRGNHVLELAEDYRIAPSGSFMAFPLAALDFQKMPDGQGLIDIGHLYLDSDVILKGGIIVNDSDCTVAGSYQPVITTYLHMDPMTVEWVRLSSINLGDQAEISQNVRPADMFPQIFYDERYTFDFNDIRFKLSLTNGLPFDGDINAAIDTYDGLDESPLKHYDLAMDFRADAVDQVKEYNDMSSMLNPVPDYILVDVNVDMHDYDEADSVDDSYGVIVPGASYDIRCGYEFIVPFSFGKNFHAVWEEKIAGFNLDLDNVDLAEANLAFNLVNTLPFDLELGCNAIDTEGNVLSDISVEIDGEVKGGSIDSPSRCPVNIRFSNTGALSMDGVELFLEMTVSQDVAVFNKNQFLQLTDISLSLPQGITYHIEENN